MIQSAAQEHLRQQRPIMAHRQQRAQIKSHEPGVARHHDPIGLAIGINQARCGVCRECVDRLLLLRGQRSAGFQLCGKRTHDRADVVIEDCRKIRVSIVRQQRLETGANAPAYIRTREIEWPAR